MFAINAFQPSQKALFLTLVLVSVSVFLFKSCEAVEFKLDGVEIGHYYGGRHLYSWCQFDEPTDFDTVKTLQGDLADCREDGTGHFTIVFNTRPGSEQFQKSYGYCELNENSQAGNKKCSAVTGLCKQLKGKIIRASECQK